VSKKKKSKLGLVSSIIVFSTVSLVFGFVLLLWALMYKLDVVGTISLNTVSRHLPVVWLILASALLGGINSLIAKKYVVKPLEDLSVTFDKLSKGDFSVRLSETDNIAEINEMAKGFNSMVKELSQIDAFRDDFVANVSHEFKTPISAIEGYATLLKYNDLSPELHERYVDKIIENSVRLSKLSSNMLSLSKLDNNQVELFKGEFRLDEQIRKTILLLENKWSQKNIDFALDLPKCKLYANEQLLEHIWFNVIDNAIKSSNDNSIIEIKIENHEHYITTIITDHGCGMSEEVKEHLFEKFYQADVSRNADGNGLGLSIVKKIVDIYEGEITVDSKINEGTTFKISLPKLVISLPR
jgi:signal transduction histidine kinase